MVLSWWVALQLFGLCVLPLALRLFGNLPDRGWAFARPLGLLVVGFVFWQGATFGLLGTTSASIFGAMLVVGIVSWLLGWTEAVGLRAFVRTQRSQVVATEIVFTVAFLLWTFVRAHNPEISATEKPMELAFLNGVLRSDQFPPNDPWLSGFGISYYYFGYVITAMIARLASVPAEVAFNLMIPTLFALTATGAFAIGANMYLGARSDALASARRAIANGLLAVALVLFLANLEPVLEILNAHNSLSPEARALFSIKDMPPGYTSGSLFPTDPPDGWWWFRATRVVATPMKPGAVRQDDYTINEFPFFSFILGDMHPHVLALPFVLMSIGFALNLLRSRVTLSLAALRRDPLMLGAVGIIFGGLGFLNAWDMPTFVFVLALAFVVQRALTAEPLHQPALTQVLVVLGTIVSGVLFAIGFSALRDAASLNAVAQAVGADSDSLGMLIRGAAFVALIATAIGGYWSITRYRQLRQVALALGGALGLGILFYLPFYLSFRSQAAGLAPVLTRTQIQHFFLFWAPFYLLIATFVVAVVRVGRQSVPAADWTRRPLLWVGTGAVAVLILAAGMVTPFQAPVVALTLPLLVGIVVAASRDLLVPRRLVAAVQASESRVEALGQEPVEIAGGAVPLGRPREHYFALILAFVGLLLILGCELVFIRDLFGNRMNTVFKLYYQAWVCLGLAGAYAIPYLVNRLRTLPYGAARFGLGLWAAALAIVFGLAFLYPFGAAASKTRGFAEPPTLDGIAFWGRFRPDELEAIRWLQANVGDAPVIVEATGGSYQQNFGRVSSMTGLPTLLGWAFHEQQWRGSFDEQARRKPDIDTIYQSNDPRLVQQLLDKYNVSYVYVGPTEREVYGRDGTQLDKFAQFMETAYKNGNVTIYRSRNRGG